MKRPRVLFFAPYSGPADVPITAALLDAGAEVRYCCVGETLRDGIADGVEVSHKPMPLVDAGSSLIQRGFAKAKRAKRDATIRTILCEEIEVWKPTHIFAADLELGLPLAEASDTPIIALSHGSDIFEVPNRSEAQATRIREALKKAAAVIALSDSHADALCAFAPNSKVVVFPPMVDAELFAPKPRPERIPRLLSIRGERGVYRQDVIKGAARLISEKTQVELRIKTKAGWKADPLLEGLSVSPIIEAISHSAMPEEYAKASLVMQAVANESLGYSTLEAMACGRAIIAIDSPINRELLPPESHALLIPELEDQEALAQAFATLANELLAKPEDLDAIGAANRTRVASNYAASAKGPHAARILHDLLESC